MEILGLIDALEAQILDSFKVPMSKKIMIDEDKVLAILDKIRLVAQGGGGFAKKALQNPNSPAQSQGGSNSNQNQNQVPMMPAKEERVETRPAPSARFSDVKANFTPEPTLEEKGQEIMQQAYQIAKEVRSGADHYADEVLANLEATTVRILRTLKAGRDRLNKNEEPADLATSNKN